MVGMQHTAVLDIAALTDLNGFGVAAHRHAKPDAGIGGNFDRAHHLCVVGYPGAVGHIGALIIQLVKCHESLLSVLGF